MPRIGLVHALHASIAPIEAAFSESWPEAETLDLFDQSLYVDYNRDGQVTPTIERRIAKLLGYSADCDVEAILFTGSLFGEAVGKARAHIDVPVLTAYEALIEAAFRCGPRLAVLATVEDTATRVRADVERYARAGGLGYEMQARHVAGAIEALLRGDRATHDRLIVEEARHLDGCDAVMLGQFSMAPVANCLPRPPGATVLTSPGTAVAKLKNLLA